MSPLDRYHGDVLSAGWNAPRKPVSEALTLERGLVVEDATSGFCGAVLRWENGLVQLEDRRGKVRSFELGPGFLLDGRPVSLQVPVRAALKGARRTASGSVATPGGDKARVALPSRIYVEGRHDAELVERIWGDDLRHVGVVVEFLGGIDDLAAVVEEFAPARAAGWACSPTTSSRAARRRGSRRPWSGGATARGSACSGTRTSTSGRP